jgi:mRNA interferase HigB
VTLIGTDKIEAFVKRQPRALAPFRAWKAEAANAVWTKPLDIKNRYRSVDFRPGNHVIFDIGGNKYRLFAQVSYPLKIIRVGWVGTHAEYDRKQF